MPLLILRTENIQVLSYKTENAQIYASLSCVLQDLVNFNNFLTRCYKTKKIQENNLLMLKLIKCLSSLDLTNEKTI